MATQAEIIRMLLADLTVIDAVTVAPATELASLAELWIDAARAELSESGLCWWDADSVPASVSVQFVRYVSSQCCGAFGRANKGYEAREIPARRRLAAIKSTEERPDVVGQFS